MIFEGRHIDSLQEGDIQSLIDSQVPEGRAVEYKSELPGSTDEAKREFLADVSSFANASGGHLVYGVTEDAGVPQAIPGVELTDPDQERLRLEQVIRNNIEPRLRFEISPVKLSSGRFVFVIRVPRSWGAPHMLTFKGGSRFYSRTSAGKYQLDVSEIRSAFLLSQTSAQRIRDFRLERIGRLAADETPVPMEGGAKVVLHLVPLDETPSALFAMEALHPLPLSDGISGSRYNIDGFVTYGLNRNGSASSYLQVFRNGAFEAVDTSMLRPYREGEHIIPSVGLARMLVDRLSDYLRYYASASIDPPIFLMLSLLGVEGYQMAVEARMRGGEPEIERDEVLVPEVMIQNLQDPASQILHPVLDAVWNATGYPRCLDYDSEGNWKPRG